MNNSFGCRADFIKSGDVKRQFNISRIFNSDVGLVFEIANAGFLNAYLYAKDYDQINFI